MVRDLDDVQQRGTGQCGEVADASTVASNENSQGEGGGLAAVGGNLTLLNSTFEANVGSQDSATGGEGGGLYLGENNAVVISGNLFLNNYATTKATNGQGGGLYAHGATNIVGNTFQGNTACTGGSFCDGGGAYLNGAIYQGGAIVFQNNTVISNTAGTGGGGVSIYNKLTFAGMTVHLYENSSLKASTTADPSGAFTVTWTSAQFYNNQTNPQVTSNNGYFAFFTPPGSYYLQATGAGGYQSWRSPVIEVITQVVHANVPLTPWSSNGVSQVTLTPSGPNPTVITVPASSNVEWLSALNATAAITDLERLTDNPLLRPLSALNPFTDTHSFDGGLLAPGRTYRRQFTVPGKYSYTDGAGHTAQVVVTNYRVYLPVVLKNH